MFKSKIVVGIFIYGKSFIFDNVVNNGVGVLIIGRGFVGRFMGEVGVLFYYEVFKIKYCLIILLNVVLFKKFVNVCCL